MTNLKNIVLKNAKLKNDNLEKLQQETDKSETDNSKNIPLLTGNNMDMLKDLMHQLNVSSLYFNDEMKKEARDVLNKMKNIEEHLTELRSKEKDFENKVLQINGAFCNNFYNDLSDRKVVSIKIRIVKPLKKQKKAFIDLCDSMGWICHHSSSKFISFYAVIDNIKELKNTFNNVLAIDNGVFCQNVLINNFYGRFTLLKELEQLATKKD